MDELKGTKYYLVSVNSTPDVSHTEKLAEIFYYVFAAGPVKRFTRFIHIYSHAGARLVRVSLEYFSKKGINIKDCCGTIL